MNKKTNKLLLNLLVIGGATVAGYYGLKNKDPKLLVLVLGKLLALGFINGKN
ncbi:MAG: hypothetical protein M0Z72_07485 [Deltaproteobacteria bacterium]|nr:hypothetical protein [Deltaproteobacteria bacterium]